VPPVRRLDPRPRGRAPGARSSARLASAAAQAIGLAVNECPWKKVSRRSSPRNASNRAPRTAVAPNGRKPPVSPFDRHTTSGSTPAPPHANSGPVRPNPVITSSATSSTPASRHRAGEGAQHRGVVHAHPGGAEHQRLDDERRQLRAARGEQRVERAQRRVAVARGAGQARHLEQVAVERRAEHAARADAHRAERVAVVGALERRHEPPRPPAVVPRLERDLHARPRPPSSRCR
jgi:hypothetical protein